MIGVLVSEPPQVRDRADRVAADGEHVTCAVDWVGGDFAVEVEDLADEVLINQSVSARICCATTLAALLSMLGITCE